MDTPQQAEGRKAASPRTWWGGVPDAPQLVWGVSHSRKIGNPGVADSGFPVKWGTKFAFWVTLALTFLP